MPVQLTITSKPLKSSRLAIPPSPFSPKFPTSTAPSPPSHDRALTYRNKAARTREFTPPPAEPLHWLWQCHVCNRVYLLGVTRRCLEDGHFFCPGTTTVKRGKKSGRKLVRHKACVSEFDYQGWKTWGVWRRLVVEQARATEALDEMFNGDVSLVATSDKGQCLNGTWTKNLVKGSAKSSGERHCWNMCDYPSECRWKQYGVQAPVLVSEVTVPSTGQKQKLDLSFEDISLDVGDTITEAEFEAQLEQYAPKAAALGDEETKPSVEDVLNSAKRRKRRSESQLPSPLASNPPSLTGTDSSSSTAEVLHKAFDDFEAEFRGSFETAGGVLSSFVDVMRNAQAPEGDKAQRERR